ncbi:MAG: monofunctional biosynthetic peptidoglycan transglycosylase [Gammaproteobacteria bacterium]|nr:monofunctional biosynthetic peptidoglycan transglycosylase [Gammaproteobacteria bacterium]MBI5617827.1 monofunctional biosynthetic peptidoglycan transglycosylase [Gammaproteobacteria bacterium]
MRIDPDPDGERRRAILSRLNQHAPSAARERPKAKPRRRRRWRRWLVLPSVVFLALTVAPVALFTTVTPPLTAFMARDWVIAQREGRTDYRLRHDWTPLRGIPAELRAAVIAAEDQKFRRHRGFDFDSIRSAMADYEDGERVRGASTITQQVAKNLFLWPGQSWMRKGIEAWYTVLIETFWGKARILEVYLNVAQFGDGIYGVGAASEVFFHCRPGALNAEQAAMLAAVLPNPIRFRIDAPSDYVRERQHWILGQMRHVGEGM